ncbi:MAG: prolipoprotein diacylglyceryl transferase [Anaplasmataceae bacterium]|nr:prolipoprotein diacylglyceryl transferase [Anaplasmataceae bacterium]
MSLPFPNIDPVIIKISVFEIRWYSLAYIAGLIYSFFFIKHNGIKFISSEKNHDLHFFWGPLSILLGGRLFYVLVYNFNYYIANPFEIVAIWQGGMSFHGALLGVLIMSYLFCKSKGIKWLQLLDILATTAPLGLMLGRLANFINGELYGRVTNMPWAIRFPNGGYLPRHPSQLYESFFEGLLLFIIVNICYKKFKNKIGFTSIMFCYCYGIFRFFIEFTRQPDINIGYIFTYFTLGQILCGAMILGMSIVLIKKKDKRI